jgi:siroheme synthase (precorrin-2 oxidase/ferrochelatase)
VYLPSAHRVKKTQCMVTGRGKVKYLGDQLGCQ